MSERRLYVGAPVRVTGWEVYHDWPHEDVDHVGAFDCMPAIASGSISIFYAALLGRIAFDDSLKVMAEWHRTMRPGAALLCTVLDVAKVGSLLDDKPTFDEQVMLTKLLGQQKSHWTPELLSTCLQTAGFINVRRAETFNLFNDASTLKLGEHSLALNVLADRL